MEEDARAEVAQTMLHPILLRRPRRRHSRLRRAAGHDHQAVAAVVETDDSLVAHNIEELYST